VRSQRVAAAGIKARRVGILTLWMPFLQDNGNSRSTPRPAQNRAELRDAAISRAVCYGLRKCSGL
jgi:hypothetical protein